MVKALPNGRWKLLINSSSFLHSKETVLRCSFAGAGSLRLSNQEHWVETSSVTPAPVSLSPSLPHCCVSQVSHFCSLALYLLTKQSNISLLSQESLSDSSLPNGPWPARLLCPWRSPGKNTAVGCHFLLL